MARRKKKINPGNELRLLPDPADLMRLLGKVKTDLSKSYKGTPCWVWQAYTDDKGYGRVSINGRNEWVHRAMYALFRRAIPAGKEMDHACKTPGCCNPYHVRPRSTAANRSDTRRPSKARPDDDIPF